jgi:hypothetical protein
MKFLKDFSSWCVESVDWVLADEICDDILPKLQYMRDNGELITPEFFENYMKKRGADLKLIDFVMSELVSRGFDFDVEKGDDTKII